MDSFPLSPEPSRWNPWTGRASHWRECCSVRRNARTPIQDPLYQGNRTNSPPEYWKSFLPYEFEDPREDEDTRKRAHLFDSGVNHSIWREQERRDGTLLRLREWNRRVPSSQASPHSPGFPSFSTSHPCNRSFVYIYSHQFHSHWMECQRTWYSGSSNQLVLIALSDPRSSLQSSYPIELSIDRTQGTILRNLNPYSKE